jgi:hypothetical protein
MTTTIELRKFADELIVDLSVLTSSRKCIIENEIAADVFIKAERDELIFILKRYLDLIIHSSYSSQIRISAVSESNCTSIYIKDNNNDYSQYISGKMEKHKSRIQDSGCYLSFEFNDKRSITVILNFTDKKLSPIKK